MANSFCLPIGGYIQMYKVAIGVKTLSNIHSSILDSVLCCTFINAKYYISFIKLHVTGHSKKLPFKIAAKKFWIQEGISEMRLDKFWKMIWHDRYDRKLMMCLWLMASCT